MCNGGNGEQFWRMANLVIGGWQNGERAGLMAELMGYEPTRMANREIKLDTHIIRYQKIPVIELCKRLMVRLA